MIGVALIGAGAIGGLRAAALAKTPGLKLQVVADVRPAAAAQLAQLYGVDSTVDWRVAVGRSDIGLVIISTPPNLHMPVAVAAAAAGKHLLCEKPLAHTLADAEQICAAARAQGVMLKTGFNHRYFPAMRYARRLIDKGTIGAVVALRAYARHPGGAEFGHGWVTDGAITGGGSLIDNGIHILDLTRFFFGDVTAVKGYTANLIWPFERAEDNAYALLRNANGAIGQVYASWTEWRGYHFAVEVHGTRGYVRAAYPPMLVEWGQIDEPGQRARPRFELFPLFQVRERLQSWRWTIVSSLVAEQRDLVSAIRAGQQVPPDGDDGLRALQLAHAIYRSAREGGEVLLQ